jgi:hypothetical protein
MQSLVGLVKIFDIDEETYELGVTPSVMEIEVLNRVVNKYKDNPIPVLKYINFMTNPYSPFNNMKDEDKEDAILTECGSNIITDCIQINNAIDFLNKLYETPTKRFYESNKILVDRLALYAKTAQITAGHNGNFSQLQSQLKSSADAMKAFKLVENAYKEEVNSIVNRGNAEQGYDEDNID